MNSKTRNILIPFIVIILIAIGFAAIDLFESDSFNGKIALTFDDGPRPDVLPDILDVLDRHNAPAAFFFVGYYITPKTEALLIRTAAEGHIIGNHTQNHKDPRDLSDEDFRNELKQIETSLMSLDINPRFMRFPYAFTSEAARNIAEKEFGYDIVKWQIDSADWCFAKSTRGPGYCDRPIENMTDEYRDDMIGWVLEQARQNDGGILLMHEIKYTADLLDEMLTTLKREGYTFVRLDDKDILRDLE